MGVADALSNHRPQGGLLQGDGHGQQQRKERALEVSFHEEIKALRMGEGEVFHGEGILAITKACCSRA